MTIEIMHGKSDYVYRQNPYQPREIDKRLNRRGARWKRHTICTTEQSARDILFKLQREAEEDSE